MQRDCSDRAVSQNLNYLIINCRFILNLNTATNPNTMQQPANELQSKVQMRPIQLISFDENKKLILSEEAVDVFNKFACSELYVVVVAGKYRTGKSYILNRVLLNRNSGFEVGHTINACTKGLWMWPQLVTIRHEDTVKQCVIVDTEGLGSLEEGENTDIKIFLMAILLSSYLIYNSVGSIDEKALENLSLVINLAEMLHKDNNQYDAQQLINSFPSFMWLVRDFSLRLQSEKGEQISSRQYLQMALRYQKPISKGIERKNSIRKKLKTFFQQRNCFTLIRPTENEKDLQNLSKLAERRLRPEFVTLISSFKDTVYSQLKPKKVRGKSVSPQGFIELCKYFVNTINSGKLPSINSHWDSLCVRQSTRIIDSYTSQYANLLQGSVRTSGDDQLTHSKKAARVLETHEKLLLQANTAIDKSFLGKLQKQLSKQRLHKCLTAIYESVINEINEQRFAQAREVVHEIFSEIIIQFTEKKLESFEQIFARFEEIKQNYKHDIRIYQSFYENSKDVFQEFLKNLKNEWEKEHSILHQKNDRLQCAIEQKTAQMKNKLEQTDIKMRQMQQQSYKISLINQQSKQQINKLKQELSTALKQKQFSQQSVCENHEKSKQTYQQQIQVMKNKFTQKLSQQQIKNQYLEVECAKLEQVNKDLQIRQRKLVREMEIFKNKCSDYLKENIEISQQLDQAKRKIFNFQKQYRKSTISTNFEGGEETLANRLNTQINELQIKLNLKEEELRNLNKVLHDQIATNQTLLRSPHHLNYQSLKKNYELEVENNKKLAAKVKGLQNILILCSLKCLICKQSLNKKHVQSHSQVCASQKHITFDVSYEYDANGHLQFVIDVVVGEYEQQWAIRKSMKSTQLFLKKMQNNFKNMDKCELFSCKPKIFNEEDITDIEQKRVYLNQMFHEYAECIWQNPFMIQFFGIDINLLSERKGNCVDRDRYSMKNSQVSSEFSLNLEELQENVDPLENMGNYANSNNLLMKTCKFSKKTFNFGPNV